MAKKDRGTPLEELKLQQRLESLADEVETLMEKELLMARLDTLVRETKYLIKKPK
jgi:hypothetical protein